MTRAGSHGDGHGEGRGRRASGASDPCALEVLNMQWRRATVADVAHLRARLAELHRRRDEFEKAD